MRLNKKGFAFSSIIYSILLLFLILIFGILSVLGSRKLVLDKVKNTVMNDLNGESETTIYKDTSGANAPELFDKMVPVYYDGYNWIYADTTKEWYDYDKKEWANAVVLVNSPSKEYKIGDNILMNDIAMMYVWIPRYKYVIFNGNNEGVAEQQIDIIFESGIRKTGTVSCVDAVNQVDSLGNSISEICTDQTNGSIINGTSTYTHPAFTFSNKELTGLWVGKFETTGTTSEPTIKPDLDSLRDANVSTLFTSIQNIKTNYNIDNIDSHMMKNMEWGAVAYLTNSKYGRCTNGTCEEVTINNAINNSSSYQTHTGCAGDGVNSSKVDTCPTANRYHTTAGVKASTTGNIYGIYDMSGGVYEYVMGNMVNPSNQFYVSSSGFESVPEVKYYDSYTYDSLNTTHSRGKLGDATKETLVTYGSNIGGWNSDYANFISSGRSWFIRGGYAGDASGAGLFYFGNSLGDATNIFGVRTVLVSYF